MELNLNAYAMAQFAIGNAARLNAIAGFALANVAAWQDWQESGNKISAAESAAALKSAMILARVPETSYRRFLSTVAGLTSRLNIDCKAAIQEARDVYTAAETPADKRDVLAVAAIVKALAGLGADSLGYLEAYATGGKSGLAGAIAKAESKAAEIAAKAALSEEEAQEAAAAEQEAQEAESANKTPQAKAAKAAAAVLAALAKSGEYMSDTDLRNIAEKIAEITAARLKISNELRAMQEAAAAKEEARRDTILAKEEAQAELTAKAQEAQEAQDAKEAARKAA